MFKKQCLIVTLISINATIVAMENNQTPPPIHSQRTSIQTDALLIQSSGPNTFHTHQHPTFTAQTVSNNPVFNAAGIVAKAAAEGAVQGVFQGAMQGVGSVIAQKIIATLNEPADEHDARTLLSKNQQIVNLASLRDEVNNFYNQVEDDEELKSAARTLRIGLGHALLSFIEKQRDEEVCIVTPLLHKVQKEVNAFGADAKDTTDQEMTTLLRNIRKNYALLLHKQIQYEKEASKPAIIIPVH